MLEIDKKGDVIFFKDSKLNKHYQIYGTDANIYRVAIGDMRYTKIKTIGEYEIKFNTDCIEGFTIWKDRNRIKMDYWEMHKAE